MLEGCLSSFHDAGARGVEHTDAVAGCRWWLSCWTRGELHEGSPDKWLCEREKSVESNARRRLHTLGKKARGLQEQEWLLKARAPPFLPPFFPPFLRFPVRRWVSMNDGEAQLAGI